MAQSVEPAGTQSGAGRLGGPESLLAACLVVVVSARIPFVVGHIGTFVALALLPLWWRCCWSSTPARMLTSLALIAPLMGVFLAATRSVDHQFSGRIALQDFMIHLQMICGVGAVLWARRFWPNWQVAALYALGSFVAVAGDSSGLPFWRSSWSFPITVLGLALAQATRRNPLQFMVVLGFAALTATGGGRSRTGVLLFVAALLVWQVRPSRRSNRARVLRTAVTAPVLGLAVYHFGQALILEGLLGERAREKTLYQIEQSGSVLLGGRPEIAATAALVRAEPNGFGLGTVPNYHDLSVAKAGLWAINYDPNNGYVERFMFGYTFELHSTVADTWARFGLVGLLLGLAVVVAVVGSVIRSSGQVSIVLLFCALSTLWDAFFSPLFSAAPVWILCLGLMGRPLLSPPPGGSRQTGFGDRRPAEPRIGRSDIPTVGQRIAADG